MSTASGLEREIQCPASAVISPTVQESGAYAERGHEIHTFCRSVIAGTPRSIALAAITDPHWRETCEQLDVGAMCAGLTNVRAEVAYRLDLESESARELGINLGRRYPPRAPFEIDGTNDAEGQKIFSGVWVVIDIKTGFVDVTRCRDNPQMRFHAAALMLKHDVPQVEARIVYVAVDGQTRTDVHVFTRLEIDSFCDELRARRERIDRANAALREGRIEVVAGSWCTYCKAKVSCPRFTSLAHAMLGSLRETHATWGTLSAVQRAEAFVLAAEAKDLAERIVESMKGIARTDPIDLPGGKVLRETGSGVRVVNADRPSRRRRVA